MGVGAPLAEPLMPQNTGRVSGPIGDLARRSWQSGLDDDSAMKRLSLELNSLRMSGTPVEPQAAGVPEKPLTPGVAAADADLLQWLDGCDFDDLGFDGSAM